MDTPTTRTTLSLLAALILPPSAAAQCELEKLVASDMNPIAHFGNAIAVQGDTAVIAAPFSDDQGVQETGSVYLFERMPSGWVEVKKLGHNSAGHEDRFGIEVAIDGDWIVVGAREDTTPSATESGSVYIYENIAGEWSLVDKVWPAANMPPQAQVDFGSGVDIDGDWFAAGAPGADLLLANAGMVETYELVAGDWVRRDVLFASDGDLGDRLGSEVVIAGDTILAAAPSEDGVGTDSGAVYVFERIAGVWTETNKLTASDASADAFFGGSMSLQGDRVLIGAAGDDASFDDGGAAYVFERVAGVWTETAKLVASDVRIVLQFGIGVALDGDRALLGVRDGANGNIGGAYLFQLVSSSWVQTAFFTPDGLQMFDDFAYEVALDGDTALLGSDTTEDINAEGSVFVYQLPVLARQYCHCASAAPCGNEDSLAGCANATAQGARLTACGTSSVAADDLALTVASIDPDKWGLIYMGTSAIDVPFGNGQRCVGGMTKRFPPHNSGASGVIGEGPGVAGFTQATFPAAFQIAAGQTWNFQGWFRDPMGPCGQAFNLSNALEVTFTP